MSVVTNLHMKLSGYLLGAEKGRGEEEEQGRGEYFYRFKCHTEALLSTRFVFMEHWRKLSQNYHQILLHNKFSEMLVNFPMYISDLVQISENLYDKGVESDKLSRFNIPMDKVLKSLQEPDKVSTCNVCL